MFSDEYASEDDSEEEEIDLDVLQTFCTKMKKFEEVLKSLTEVEEEATGEGEGDEYYDEEADYGEEGEEYGNE